MSDKPPMNWIKDEVAKLQNSSVAANTGATPNQILTAAETWAVESDLRWESLSVEDKASWCAAMDRIAGHLVPEGFAIVPASAVPTEEQRAAVGRIVEAVRLDSSYAEIVIDKSKSDYDALIEMGRIHAEALAAHKAIQPGDIEAARAVAEGGTNDR